MQTLTTSPEIAANATADASGAHTPDLETPDTAVPVPARSFTFEMPLFRPGVAVQEGGRTETVSHVILRRREMMVYLVGREDPVRPDRLRLQPSKFTTARRAEGLSWFL